MHHVSHLMTAYVHDELPRHLRERVIRHVETCDACYAALRREREMTRLLEMQMPTWGNPRPDQLSRLLPDILREATGRPRQSRGRALPGFGLALVLSLVLALAVPVLASARVATEFGPSQPAPYMIQATATPDRTDAPRASLAAPTAVAQHFEVKSATEPALGPAPVPVASTPIR